MKFVHLTQPSAEEIQNTITPLKVTPAASRTGETPKPNPIWGDDAPLTLLEAANFLGMPLPTLKDKVYSRQITSLKIGGHRKLRPSAIRRYIEKNELPAI